ncbi:MAG: hypothetical protein ACI93P_002531, partial [bacterium]
SSLHRLKRPDFELNKSLLSSFNKTKTLEDFHLNFD